MLYDLLFPRLVFVLLSFVAHSHTSSAVRSRISALDVIKTDRMQNNARFFYSCLAQARQLKLTNANTRAPPSAVYETSLIAIQRMDHL